jgi:hypothetical protein
MEGSASLLCVSGKLNLSTKMAVEVEVATEAVVTHATVQEVHVEGNNG